MSEFKEWPKTQRLFKQIVVTEKIDGTNAQILIEPVNETNSLDPNVTVHGEYAVFTGSRNRWVTVNNDNQGFANWVVSNIETLTEDLGYGRHYGEWALGNIQKRYAIKEKKFFLFNTAVWKGPFKTPQLDVVPVLYEGVFSQTAITECLEKLLLNGSTLNPKAEAEGIVVYHTAINKCFKITLPYDKGKWEV